MLLLMLVLLPEPFTVSVPVPKIALSTSKWPPPPTWKSIFTFLLLVHEAFTRMPPVAPVTGSLSPSTTKSTFSILDHSACEIFNVPGMAAPNNVILSLTTKFLMVNFVRSFNVPFKSTSRAAMLNSNPGEAGLASTFPTANKPSTLNAKFSVSVISPNITGAPGPVINVPFRVTVPPTLEVSKPPVYV